MRELRGTRIVGLVALISLSVPLTPASPADEPPPIQIIFDVHADPMHHIPLEQRPEVYAAWRDATNWALHECELRGARITFLSVGEFMVYVLEDHAEGWPLIDHLCASGGTIGTHSHDDKKFGPHDWRPIGHDPPLPLVIELWEDHINAVNAVIMVALGVTDPEEIRQINNSRGSHVPPDDLLRIALMEQFGFSIHQQGPAEEFYGYFQHYVMNPYRPSGHHYLSHDFGGPVVTSPFGPVIGKNGVHFGIPQDMRLPALKTLFLLELLNWLDDTYVAGTGRVWCFGWAAHTHDLLEGQPPRYAVPPMLEWLEANFVDQPVSGRPAAMFSSAAQSRDLFLEWEAGHPNGVPFNYPASETNWALYPYLEPVARYLVGGQYDGAEGLGPIRLHRVIASPEIGGPFEMYVVYPIVPESVTSDLTPVLGPREIGTVCPRSGLAPVVFAENVTVPPTGLILVPPDRRLRLPNGDTNLDGLVDLADLSRVLGAFGSCVGDPEFDPEADVIPDGCVNLADLARLLSHYGGSCP